MKKTILTVLLLSGLALSACKSRKQPDPEPEQTETEAPDALDELAMRFKNGEISECTHEGQTVYVCGLNANDAGTEIFNQEGEKIATCNYGWGKPDPMCKEVENCKVLYRVADNIWGKPAVDRLSDR